MGTDILILTAPFGSGHTAAANATAAGLKSAPGHLTAGAPLRVEVVDLAEHSRLLRVMVTAYMGLLKGSPGLYRFIFGVTAGPGGRGTANNLLTRLLLAPMRRLLQVHQPRLLVCSHPFPAAMAARLRQTGELAAPVCTVVTDFHAHPLWVQPGVDRYCVPATSTAQDLIAAGADPARIAVTGIPIRSGFQPAAAAPTGQRVLVLGGGLGLGPLPEVARALSAQGLPVTVVCGTNRPMHAKLIAQGPANLTVLGYTQEIAALMQESRVLVTKPGGLSCSEALAAGLPMVLIGHLPGHEEENAAALVEAGAALSAGSGGDVLTHVQALLQDAAAHQRLREACLAIGRPDSAAAVARELAALLASSHS